MMDKKTVEGIRADMMGAIKFIEKKYNVTVHGRGGRYNDATYDAKIQFVSNQVAPKTVTETTIKGGYANPGTVVNHYQLGRGVITKTNRINYIVKFDERTNLYKVPHYVLTPPVK